jgi:hypothetical protein
MDDVRERVAIARRLELPDVVGRPRAHDGQHALDRLQDTGHAAERERRRDKGDDLAVVIAFEPADDVDGIGG